MGWAREDPCPVEKVALPAGMAMLATVNKWEKLDGRYGGWPAHFLSGELSAPLAGIQNVAV